MNERRRGKTEVLENEKTMGKRDDKEEGENR